MVHSLLTRFNANLKPGNILVAERPLAGSHGTYALITGQRGDYFDTVLLDNPENIHDAETIEGQRLLEENGILKGTKEVKGSILNGTDEGIVGFSGRHHYANPIHGRTVYALRLTMVHRYLNAEGAQAMNGFAVSVGLDACRKLAGTGPKKVILGHTPKSRDKLHDEFKSGAWRFCVQGTPESVMDPENNGTYYRAHVERGSFFKIPPTLGDCPKVSGV